MTTDGGQNLTEAHTNTMMPLQATEYNLKLDACAARTLLKLYK